MTRKTSRHPRRNQGAVLEATAQLDPLPFVESCLPLTTELANQHRSRVDALLDPATAQLPFEDRVLLMLAPYWRTDVEGFHGPGGDSMQQAHEPHKLRRFDEHYRERLELLLRGDL